MDLLQMVKGYLGDETIGRIANTVGMNQGMAKTAIGAVAPTLLAGVAHTASSGQEGAQRVASAVDNADENITSNFGPMLSTGGGAAQSLSQGGTSMLSNLFGMGTTNGIVEAISRYTGVGAGESGKLIGMVAPLIFGVLKKQKTSMGLDSGGLANLLSSQKSSFMSAMPSGLTGMLSSIPGLSAMTGAAGAAATAARGYAASATGAARETASSAANAAKESATSAADSAREAASRARVYSRSAMAGHEQAASAARWTVPIVILCILVALGLWWGLSRHPERPNAPQQQAVTPAPAPEGQPSAQEAGAQLGENAAATMSTKVSEVFSSASNTFADVHDAASAEAAAPKIDAINKQLDTMDQTMKTLSPDARSKLAATIKESRDKLQSTTDKVLAMPGVSDKLKPSVDEMYKKIDALTAAQ